MSFRHITQQYVNDEVPVSFDNSNYNATGVDSPVFYTCAYGYNLALRPNMIDHHEPPQLLIAFNHEQFTPYNISVQQLHSIIQQIDTLPELPIPAYSLVPSLCDSNQQLSHRHHALLLAHTLHQLIQYAMPKQSDNTYIAVNDYDDTLPTYLPYLPHSFLQHIIPYCTLYDTISLSRTCKSIYHTTMHDTTFKLLYQRDFESTFHDRSRDYGVRSHCTWYRLYRGALWSLRYGRNTVQQTRVLARHNYCMLVTVLPYLTIKLPHRAGQLTQLGDIIKPSNIHIWSKQLYVCTKKTLSDDYYSADSGSEQVDSRWNS